MTQHFPGQPSERGPQPHPPMGGQPQGAQPASWPQPHPPAGGQPQGAPHLAAPAPSTPYGVPTAYGPPSAPPGAPAGDKGSRPWFKKKRFIIPGGVVLLLLIAGIAGGGADEPTTSAALPTQKADAQTADDQAETVAEQTVEVPDVVGMTVEEATAALDGFAVELIGTTGEVESQAPSGGIDVEPGSRVVLTVVDRAAQEAAAAAAAAAEAARIGTISQQNAYRSAASYLDFAAFSRAGLIDQLTSEYGEGYPPEDAEFAVARLEAEGGVDWNAEAAESAQSYLEFSAFSRQGLLDQLTSEYGEQFTPEQAEYGVSTTGL